MTQTETELILSVIGISSHSEIGTGIGCLIRDISGSWVCGYARVIGITTNIGSELKAIQYGLRLAVQNGLKKNKLESESALALECLSNHNPYNLEKNLVDKDLVEIINNIRSKEFDVCEFVHIPSSNNAHVGVVCNYAFNMNNSARVKELYLSPTAIQDILQAERRGYWEWGMKIFQFSEC